MRNPKEKPTSPVRPKPACYCITDEQGTILHRIYSGCSPLRLHHFAALAHFLETTDRPERLHAILNEWLINSLNENFGTWLYEQEDLGDMGQLLDFLSRCYRQPSALELENLLRTE